MDNDKKPLSIAIQGISGSFHHEAAMVYFQKDFDLLECMTFKSLIAETANGKASFGLIAVENSLVGGMLPNLTLIRESGLIVNGELYLRISQNLMALPGQEIHNLKEVHSHPLAIMQSEAFFSKYPHIRLVESSDTALSAKLISENNLFEAGAIGSEAAARLYNLSVLSSAIETNKENYTRFLIIGKHPAVIKDEEKVKASLAFIIPHAPGSLLRVLRPLSDAGVNLTMLQSLPLVGEKWQYIFHADMIFQNKPTAMRMIDHISGLLKHLWVMGIYPLRNRSGNSQYPVGKSKMEGDNGEGWVIGHGLTKTGV